MEILSIKKTSYVTIYKPKLSSSYGIESLIEETIEVSERDPLAEIIQSREEILKFQFFDIKVITLSDGDEYYSKPKNYSQIYYTGTREELEMIPLWMKPKDTTSLTTAIYYPDCFGNRIFLTKETEGITIEEYIQKQINLVDLKKREKNRPK